MEHMEISDLRNEYLICRTIGHSWDEIPNAEFSETSLVGTVGAMALRCTRCYAERYDYIGKDLSVADRRYKYPDHYTTIPGEGTRPNLRGELLKRSILIQSFNRRRNGRQKS